MSKSRCGACGHAHVPGNECGGPLGKSPERGVRCKCTYVDTRARERDEMLAELEGLRAFRATVERLVDGADVITTGFSTSGTPYRERVVYARELEGVLEGRITG